MPFGVTDSHELKDAFCMRMWVHMGAIWKIRFNGPCGAAVRAVATIRPTVATAVKVENLR